MLPVRIFTTLICAHCIRAKYLLKKRNIPYEEVDVTGDITQRTWLVATTGRRTVPQIFVGDASIGGYEELAALDRSGELERLLSR